MILLETQQMYHEFVLLFHPACTASKCVPSEDVFGPVWASGHRDV